MTTPRPRPLGQRELDLIHRYANCQLTMSPRAFESKWSVTRQQIAALCQCSIGTVQRWFKRGQSYRPPTRYHLRYLALADIFIEYFEEIPATIRELICPAAENQIEINKS